MEIKINFEKRHAFLILTGIALFALFGFAFASSPTTTQGWHNGNHIALNGSVTLGDVAGTLAKLSGVNGEEICTSINIGTNPCLSALNAALPQNDGTYAESAGTAVTANVANKLRGFTSGGGTTSQDVVVRQFTTSGSSFYSDYYILVGGTTATNALKAKAGYADRTPWTGIEGVPAGFGDGTDNIGSLNCKNEWGSLDDDDNDGFWEGTISCGSGYIMTGGGLHCSGSTMTVSQPTDTNGWEGICKSPGQETMKVWSRCCKIS